MSNGGAIGSTNTANPTDPTSLAKLQDKWMFGLRMTLNSWDHFGHEFTYAYHRTALQTTAPSTPAGQFTPAGPLVTSATGTAIHTVTYGMLAYATAEGKRIRPFAQGGGGFSNFIYPGGSVSRGGGNTKLGIYYGGGIKVRLTEDGPFWIRADFRQHMTGMPYNLAGQSGALRRNEISVGVSYGL